MQTVIGFGSLIVIAIAALVLIGRGHHAGRTISERLLYSWIAAGEWWCNIGHGADAGLKQYRMHRSATRIELVSQAWRERTQPEPAGDIAKEWEAAAARQRNGRVAVSFDCNDCGTAVYAAPLIPKYSDRWLCSECFAKHGKPDIAPETICPGCHRKIVTGECETEPEWHEGKKYCSAGCVLKHYGKDVSGVDLSQPPTPEAANA